MVDLREPRPTGRPPLTGNLEKATENAELQRPDMRPDLHIEDPRERARIRARQILEHISDIDDTTDEFYIPESIIPDGWTYQWKMWSVLNQHDPHYQSDLRRKGWDYVPASRHPDMAPMGSSEQRIFRKGMVLMERPTEVDDIVKERYVQAAKNQVKMKEQQLNSEPPGTFERVNKDAPLAKVKKSWSPMPTPDA